MRSNNIFLKVSYGAAVLIILAVVVFFPTAARLHDAIRDDNPNAISRILRLRPGLANADLGAGDGIPLQIAIEMSKTRSARALIERCAVLNPGDDNYTKALLKAASYNNATPEMLGLFIDNGANLSATDENGDNALHVIVGKKGSSSLNAVSLLLSKGASPNAKNNEGRTPLHLVASWPADAWNSSPNAGPAMIGLLHTNEADVNAIDKQGKTPLHLAVESSRDAMSLLLTLGANPNAIDGDGRTPLHYLAEMTGEHTKDLALLIESGAQVGIADIHGRTPLHLAAKGRVSTDKDTMDFDARVALLISKGASLNAKDEDGETPRAILAQLNSSDSGGGSYYGMGTFRYTPPPYIPLPQYIPPRQTYIPYREPYREPYRPPGRW